MCPPIARFSAVFLFCAQLLPLGLPLMCEQVRHDPSAGCEQQMPSQHIAAVDVERAAPRCENPALCPAHVTAMPAFDATTLVLAGDATTARAVLETFTPLARLAPLPPPPKA